jgi:hypothetical protein
MHVSGDQQSPSSEKVIPNLKTLVDIDATEE